jgi:hypothetical protein
MATDTLLNITMITNESLMVLENSLPFTSQVLRTYDDQFGVDGAKIGDTLNVRRPARFVGRSGPNLSLEDFYQSSVPIQLGNTAAFGAQFGVDTSFTTKDLRLALGAFSENVVKPAVATIANKVDVDGLSMAKLYTGNIVGTPGTAPSQLLTYLNAGAYLDSEGAPRDGSRAVVVEQFTGATIVDSLKGLFMPDAKISEQYRSGLMGRDSAGMNWKMGQNVAIQTFGNWGTGTLTLTADTTAAGANSMLASGWAQTSTIVITASASIALNAGDVISFANVFPVNPQSRLQYGKNTRTFTVQTAISVASVTATITVSPAMIYAGQFQNITITASSATATATPYNIATASSLNVSSPQNIMFHKNAFTFACADLMLPGGVVEAARAASKEAGLSIRLIRQYTINNDQIPARFDILYGWAPMYQELACRICA